MILIYIIAIALVLAFSSLCTYIYIGTISRREYVSTKIAILLMLTIPALCIFIAVLIINLVNIYMLLFNYMLI